jgi:Family of unknown function (DUF5709)
MSDPRHAQQHAQQHDLGEAIQLDNADTLAGPLDDDPLDSGWVPPDRPVAIDKDPEEETLEQRLAEEEPDEDGDRDSYDPELAYPALPEAQEFAAEVDTELGLADGDRDSDEEGYGDRAGRLVAPDEGAHSDDESDLIGTDVGIDGGAASAEEAAMHLEPER